MAKLPKPPSVAELTRLGATTVQRAAARRWWRIYFRAGPHPTTWSELRHFGPTNARFDHHPDPPQAHRTHAILYAAQDAQTCLAEVFQKGDVRRQRTIDRRQGAPWLVAFDLAMHLQLLELTELWPTFAGASRAISSGRRDHARLWSRAIHAAFSSAHGLQYRSSMAGALPAFALYERGTTALPARPVIHRALADRLLDTPLRNAAARLGYRLI